MQQRKACEPDAALSTEERRPAFIVVDDDPVVLAAMGRILQDTGEVRVALNGPDALRLALDSPPDLMLLDIDMPGMSGFEVCVAMKQNAALADIPIIFSTSHDSTQDEVKGLDLGAADFISKPPRPALLLARVRTHLRMKRMADLLRHHARVDALTGVANRRRLDEDLQTEWLRTRRNREPISLLIIDIDFFKRFNDAHGHQAGDQCLRSVAQVMKSALHRPSDLLARYGGEEFAVVLPGTDRVGAQVVAQHLLEAIRDASIVHGDSPISRTVSVSIGICTCSNDVERMGQDAASQRADQTSPGYSVSDLVAAADAALYQVKEHGRRHARLMMLGSEVVEDVATTVAPSPNVTAPVGDVALAGPSRW